MTDGLLQQAVANAVLALYGQPRPAWDTPLAEVAALLNRLAEDRRGDATERG